VSGDDSGAALLVTVLILLVVSVLGAAVVNQGSVDYRLSSNYRSSMVALNLADSGLNAAAADLRADYDADPSDNWLVDWLNTGTAPPSVPTPFPDVSGTTVNGYTLTQASPSPNPYPGTAYDLGGPAALGSGTYGRTIWLPPTITMNNGTPVVNIRVRSTGVDGNVATPANATIDGVVTIDLTDSSPYSTGAFLGAGEGGDLIRGGPVRIAGAVVAIGNPPRRRGPLSWLFSGTRLNLTNGSSIVNNYSGIDGASALGALSSKLPALGSFDLNGETVDNLGASLHLKDVTTVISRWGGQLGEPDASGDAYKETLDGVYTDDRIIPYTGNLYADSVSGSDLADDLVFPSLTAPYTDPNSGADYPSFADFLDSNSYQPVTGGDVAISSATPSFAWTDPAGDGSVAWDATTETLTIDGIVKINGSVSFGDPRIPGGDQLTAINYEGTGVLWATDDVTITKDIFPTGKFLEDGPDPDSAVDGNLGIISSDEIIIDGSGPFAGRGRGRGRGGPPRGRGGGGTGDANLQILATLFAERRLRVETRANIAGSVVTNAINVNRRTRLNIWHAPSLAGNAANGMPVGMMIADIEVAISEWFQRR
jgi:hypothetical protein